MSKKFTEHEVICHGAVNSQFFQGMGTHGTKWEESVTGIGSTEAEAYADAVELAHQGEHGEGLKFPARPRGVNAKNKIPAEALKDDMNEVHMHVTIRYRRTWSAELAREIAEEIDRRCLPREQVVNLRKGITRRQILAVLSAWDKIQTGRFPFKSCHKKALREIGKYERANGPMGDEELIAYYEEICTRIVNTID